MIRIFSYVLLAGYITSCSSSSQVSSLLCEQVTLSHNNHHDTSKVVLEGRVVFDTTANRIRGKVIDRSSLAPLPNVIILMKQDKRKFTDTTNGEGVFSIFENNFRGIWTMTTARNDYKCLIIDSIMVGGGQDLTLKLKKQH